MFCPNPVAFTIFGHDIYWYGILISLSVVLAVIMVYREAQRKGINADSMLDYALLTVPVAIVFARLYYCAFEWEQYAANPISILYIWEGGIAVYGSIIGGVIATLIFSKWKKISFWQLTDLVAPGLVLGQAIGRWGNFFNQEAYGEIVTNASLQFFPFSVYIEQLGEWHYATFFYESAFCFLVFIFLLIYRRKAKNAPVGNVFMWYAFLYGIERAFVEGLRTDSLWFLKGGIPIGQLIFFPDGLRVSQVLAIVTALVFGIIILTRFVKRRKALAAAKPEPTLDPDLELIQENQDGEAVSAEETPDADPEHSQPDADDDDAVDAAAVIMGAQIVKDAIEANKEDASDDASDDVADNAADDASDDASDDSSGDEE